MIAFIVICVLLLSFYTSFSTCISFEYNPRCLIPECESLEAVDFSPPWILNAVPANGNSVANCHRYETLNDSTTRTNECPAELFNRDVVIGCTDYVYENADTLVYHVSLKSSNT